MDIKRTKQPIRQPIAIPLITTTLNDKPTTANFKISDIHYGTLITGAAMRNIQRRNSIVSNNDELGIIAHNLMNRDLDNTSFTFNIDTANKTLAIIGEFDLFEVFTSELTETLKFEWNFRE